MALPPMWKVKREIVRVSSRIKVAVWRWSGTKTSIEYEGLSVPMHRTGMNPEVVMAIARKIYEQPEIRGVRLAVVPGDRILEVGCGLGIVTALAARATSQTGRVLAFEANPEMIPATRDFLADHGIANVELRHAVLVPQAEPGETRDFHLAKSFASSSLMGVDQRRARGVISVPTQPLGDVIAEFRPDVLICDIEGGEAELIPALDASGLRAVVIELHPDRLGQDELDAIHSALAAHGLHPTKEPLGGTVVLFHRLPHP